MAIDEVEKHLGDRINETSDRIDQTNDQIDQTNDRIDQTNDLFDSLGNRGLTTSTRRPSRKQS